MAQGKEVVCLMNPLTLKNLCREARPNSFFSISWSPALGTNIQWIDIEKSSMILAVSGTKDYETSQRFYDEAIQKGLLNEASR